VLREWSSRLYLPHQSLTSTALTYLSADIQLVSEHGRCHLPVHPYPPSLSHPSFHLAVPCTCTTLGDGSFAVAGPRMWSSLPATIRQITSYRQFRQRVKIHLFRAYKSQRIVALDYCVLYKYSYLLTWRRSLINANNFCVLYVYQRGPGERLSKWTV